MTSSATESKMTCWHVTITEHQIHPYLEIHRKFDGIKQINTFEKIDRVRDLQGWKEPLAQNIYIHNFCGFLGFFAAILYLVQNRNSTQIFGSVFEKISIFLIFVFSCAISKKTFLISEPYCDVPLGYFSGFPTFKDKIKCYLRPFIYKFYFRIFRSSVSGVFAISDKAAKQMISSGLNRSKLIDYGYFVPKVTETNLVPKLKKFSSLQLVFIGSLIPRKGIDLLIEALDQLNRMGINVTLDMYGPIDGQLSFEDCHYVKYRGLIPFGEGESFCQKYDCLVLPSYYDGWGVVVNEAVNAGICVICSDAVGSKKIIETFDVGRVFRSGEVNSLINVILEVNKLCGYGFPSARSINSAQKSINPSDAAEYLWSATNGLLTSNLFSCHDVNGD